MRAVLKTTNPDAVEFTLTVTMNLKGWRELQEALRGNSTWVGTQLSLQITDMVFRAYQKEKALADARNSKMAGLAAFVAGPETKRAVK